MTTRSSWSWRETRTWDAIIQYCQDVSIHFIPKHTVIANSKILLQMIIERNIVGCDTDLDTHHLTKRSYGNS